MKFAQEFRKALQQEDFPQKWKDCAIPYGQLKKCLKKVIKELQEIGLDKDTLARLAAGQPQSSGHVTADFGFKYHLSGKTAVSTPDSDSVSGTTRLRPRLTVFVHLEDGMAVDAKLSPPTREFLQRLVLNTRSVGGHGLSASQSASHTSLAPAPSGSGDVVTSGSNDVRHIEVPLTFDAEFFEILQTDVSHLGALQEEEQAKLEDRIVTLGIDLGRAVEPSRGRRAMTDLVVWRQIFALYLDARVFFSSRESDHGARTSTQAVAQLRWFQEQVMQQRLVQRLKLGASRATFDHFVAINAALLSILKFQEINRLAVSKILKKFDKRTSLGVSTSFPVVVQPVRTLAGSVARDVCARMSTELISVVPQLDDYLCPICFVVAYWPVRLHCDHVFCSRCLVKMSQRGERHCPLCRADTVMMAGIANFDADRAAFLRKYFPKEVKEKIRANERERNQEIFGPAHNSVHCCTM
ncbi:RING-14 protein [Poronia punctata]|nr:RING-14 protein [Poronia punctata]